MEPELFDMLSDTLTYEAPDGTYTDRGQPNYSAAVTYPCRIEPAGGDEIVRGPTGEENKARWRIYVGTATVLNPEGRITLPAGFDPQTPPVFAIGRQADDVASHHQIVLI